MDLTVEGGAVRGALVKDRRGGEDVRIDADYVVNASGAWAGRIAAMAGCDVTVLPGKGIMIAMNHRLVNTVVNRCEMPADGDIIVPIRTVSVIGTTDQKVADPDDWQINRDEIQKMMDAGENLVPGFRQARALRVWGGVRPLYQDKPEGADTRDVTRAHTLLNHRKRDGVERFLTITGGKFCTFRLMAEDTVDALCAEVGVDQPCRTARRSTSTTSAGRSGWGWGPARAVSASIEPQGSCTRWGRWPGRPPTALCSTSSRNGGRGSSRSCTATSSARPGWTTGSSRGSSTSLTSRVPGWAPHEP